jgi:hypothetical protein
MNKGRLLGFAALFAWGVAKLPLETKLAATMSSQRLGGHKITASVRQQAGQAGFVAALGGLRGTVADLLWIKAHTAWQNGEYGRMKVIFDVCLALQPRRETFYDMAAWHMAWNGAAYMEKTIADPEERAKRMMEYYKVGEAYLLQGIENMPENWKLHERLGSLYEAKLNDPWKAHLAYLESGRRLGHLDYVRRLAAYLLARVPGKEREAYEGLLALFNEGEGEWLPTLLRQLQAMERKLKIPDEQRIYKRAVKLAASPGTAAKALDDLVDLFRVGGTEPEIVQTIERLEEQLDVPEEKRIFAVAMSLAGHRGWQEESYVRLRAIYEAGGDRPHPGIEQAIRDLEEKIGIPNERRVIVPPDNRQPPAR